MARPSSYSALLALAVVLSIGAWWISREPSSGSANLQTPGLSAPQGEAKELASSEVPDEPVRLEANRELQVETSAGEFWIDLRLRDAQLDGGLIGQVWDANGGLLVETALDGSARLNGEWGLSGPLRITAKGYQSRELSPPGVELEGEWLVHLEPQLSTTISTFTPDGTPISDVSIRVSRQTAHAAGRPWPSSLPPSNQPVIEGRTDLLGRFAFPLVGLAVADLTFPSGSAQRVQIAAGENVRIIAQPESASLVFLDAATGNALVGFVVSVREPLAARHTKALRVADGQGRVFVAAGTRELIIEMTDERWTSAECDESARVTDLGNGYSFRFENLRAGESIEIRVESCGVGLRLTDAQSEGAAVEGRLAVRYERGFTPEGQGMRWTRVPFSQFEVDLVGGECVLGCKLLTRRSAYRIRLEVDGYKPTFLLPSELQSNAPIKIVQLQPGGRGVRARVLYEDGSPLRGKFSVLDEASGSMYEELTSDAGGRLGEVAWDGEGIEIFYTSAEPLFGADPPKTGHSAFSIGTTRRRSIGRIGGAAIEQGDPTLRIEVSPVRGSLRVHGLPQGAPVLMALAEEGNRQRVSRIEGAMAVFEQLPVGSYIVGPKAWLDRLESQHQGPTSEDAGELIVEVVAGESRELTWDPRWQMQAALEGQVLCAPEMLSELCLRPWYGTRVGRTTDLGRRRVYLDDEGRYRIPAGEPRPEVLLVCTANSSFWIQVLQAFEAGQNTRVELGSMTLEWEGERPEEGAVTVLYWGAEMDFDTEFNDRRPAGFNLKWNTLGPLRLSAVPTAVRDVRLDVGRDARRAFQVVIEDGKETRVLLSRGAGKEVPLGR